METKARGGCGAILARGSGGAIVLMVVAKAYGGGAIWSIVLSSDEVVSMRVRQGPLLRRQLASVRVYEREELFLQQLGCRHGHAQAQHKLHEKRLLRAHRLFEHVHAEWKRVLQLRVAIAVNWPACLRARVCRQHNSTTSYQNSKARKHAHIIQIRFLPLCPAMGEGRDW